MKNSSDTHNLSRVALAVIFSFWFLVVGTCPAFAAAVSVDALWSGLFDNSGQPLTAGKVYTYAAGTTTPKATYLDAAKSTTGPNPLVLDAYGRVQAWADGSYKFVIKDADDVTLATIDNLEYVSSQNPTTLAVTNLSATGATLGSLTANVGVLTNMTISSATITLANLISPNIANASLSGILYSPTINTATITSPNITGGTLNSSTLATATITNPTITGGTLVNVNISSATVDGGTISQLASNAVTVASMTEYVDTAIVIALGNYNEIPHFVGAYNNTSGTTYIEQQVAPSSVTTTLPYATFAIANTSATYTWTANVDCPLVIRVTITDNRNLADKVVFNMIDGDGNIYDTDMHTILDPVTPNTYLWYTIKLRGTVTIPPSQTKTMYLQRLASDRYTDVKSYGAGSWINDPFRVTIWTKLGS